MHVQGLYAENYKEIKDLNENSQNNSEKKMQNAHYPILRLTINLQQSRVLYQ